MSLADAWSLYGTACTFFYLHRHKMYAGADVVDVALTIFRAMPRPLPLQPKRRHQFNLSTTPHHISSDDCTRIFLSQLPTAAASPSCAKCGRGRRYVRARGAISFSRRQLTNHDQHSRSHYRRLICSKHGLYAHRRVTTRAPTMVSTGSCEFKTSLTLLLRQSSSSRRALAGKRDWRSFCSMKLND
jgi:hypothetical protein